MKRFLCILLLVALSVSCAPARAEESPRDFVTRYMQALQHRDYGRLLGFFDITLPAEAVAAIGPMLERQPYFIWGVKGFNIVDVKQDGGLALVTVDETQFKDIAPEGRAWLETMLPAMASAINWGDNVVRERFVLVRLDGRWQFDATHSGVQMGPVMSVVTDAVSRGGDPLKDEKTQLGLAKFINGIGFGQLAQTLGSAGPALPVVGALIVPNFLRARGEGQTVSCKSNLKNLGTALEMYSVDNEGRFPTSLGRLRGNYLKQIPSCPSAGRDTYSHAFVSSSNPDAYTIVCEGHHHADIGYSANFPQYTSTQGLLQR